MRGGLAVLLLVFFSTLPVALPFLLFGDLYRAARVSDATGLVMLFVIGTRLRTPRRPAPHARGTDHGRDRRRPQRHRDPARRVSVATEYLPRPRGSSARTRRAGCAGTSIAGVVLAAYLLPAGIGDASLAGLPPEAGLYSCLFAGLVFWLFCSSRHTAVTVTSAISLLVGTSLGDLAGGDAGALRRARLGHRPHRGRAGLRGLGSSAPEAS